MERENEQREVPVQNTEEQPEIIYVGQRRAYTRRFGCGLAVLAWLLVLLIPGFLFLLAIQGEIVLWHGGDVPASESHPLLQVKLLMEIETRGLNITRSTPVTQSESETCMQTVVSYLLWQGEGSNVSYCDCYERANETWQLTSTGDGSCAVSD